MIKAEEKLKKEQLGKKMVTTGNRVTFIYVFILDFLFFSFLFCLLVWSELIIINRFPFIWYCSFVCCWYIYLVVRIISSQPAHCSFYVSLAKNHELHTYKHRHSHTQRTVIIPTAILYISCKQHMTNTLVDLFIKI